MRGGGPERRIFFLRALWRGVGCRAGVRACVRASGRPCPPPGTKSMKLYKVFHYFFENKRSHAAWRSKCSVSLWRRCAPVLYFAVSGAPPFSSCCIFGALVLCFPIIRGRPLYFLKLRFSVLVLWCLIFQYAARSLFHFLALPWVAFWRAGSGRALEVLNATWLSVCPFVCAAQTPSPDKKHEIIQGFSLFF